MWRAVRSIMLRRINASIRILSTAALPTSSSPVLKSYEELPGQRNHTLFLLPTMLWRVISNGGPFRALYNFMLEDPKRYGRIYRQFDVNTEMYQVVLTDPAEIQYVFQQEEKYPRRDLLPFFDLFFRQYKRQPGVFFSEGHQWQVYRDTISKKMLRPQEIEHYTKHFDPVSKDFAQRLAGMRSTSQKTCNEVDNLAHEAFKWSFESISVFLYDRRMGALDNDPPKEALEFLQNVKRFMSSSMKLVFFPQSLDRFYRPKAVRDTFEAFDNIYSCTQRFVDKRLEAMAVDETHQTHSGTVGFIPSLLVSNGDQKNIYNTIVDIFLAGVDTTSNTTLWSLYNLSKHLEVQEKLYQEISKKLEETGGEISFKVLQEMSYLRAVIKETLRLYPAAVVLTRVLPTDTILSGYLVPKNTVIVANLYCLGMTEEYFPEPKLFRPERWLRSNKTADQIASFTYMPFGHGVRMCVGRRVAEMEVSLALVRILQRFQLTYPEEEVVEKSLQTITVPDRPLRIRFHDRL